MSKPRIVWDSEYGRIDPKKRPPPKPKGDGIVRIRREIGGRRGKTVTSINGLLLDQAGLQKIAKELKTRCGVGGAVKDGVIELQGDHREAVQTLLEERGYKVKLAGG